jgi:hypothetical protein
MPHFLAASIGCSPPSCCSALFFATVLIVLKKASHDDSHVDFSLGWFKRKSTENLVFLHVLTIKYLGSLQIFL